MNNFLKVIIASFFSICVCYKTYAFSSASEASQTSSGNSTSGKAKKGGFSGGGVTSGAFK